MEKTRTGELHGGLLDLDASYMEMHAEGAMPVRQKIDWAPYDRQPTTSVALPNIKTLLQKPAYSLLLQRFLPEMRKCYRSKGDQLDLYLIVQETAILVQDDGLLIFGDKEKGLMIQQSFDVYHQLGQPHLAEYQVTFQERQAVIHVGNHHFHLPQFEAR